MKKNLQIYLSAFLVCLSVYSFGQKQNLTDAALRMKKYNPMNGIEPSLKLLNEAKKFIDLAAVNTETANSPKMHLYRAEIYYGLIEMAGMEAATSGKVMDETLASEYEKIAKESFKKVFEDPKKVHVGEAENFINFRVNYIFEMGIKSYTNKKFEDATDLFIGAYEVSKFLDKEYKDASVNAYLSMSQAVDSFLTIKQFEKAKTIANKVYEISPTNIDVLISLINIYLADNDLINAEKYTSEALALDPNNKQLYYVLGTSYMTLKQNEKAEEALTKALAIDTSYGDAQYQLGAHLFNWSNELKYQAGQMDYKDPKAPILEAQAKDMLLRAMPLLEAYAIKNPTDKYVLEILQKSHYKLGNKEKSEAFKKRVEALKQ